MKKIDPLSNAVRAAAVCRNLQITSKHWKSISDRTNELRSLFRLPKEMGTLMTANLSLIIQKKYGN